MQDICNPFSVGKHSAFKMSFVGGKRSSEGMKYNIQCCSVQALQGSRQQRADANRRAGIAEESTDEEMGEEAEQESDMAGGQGGLHSGEEGHDAALDSFVASLLQRTSLNGSPGARPSAPHA
jgi:hypothetical protein